MNARQILNPLGMTDDALFNLYEVPRGTKVRFMGKDYILEHIDGMYSVCYDAWGNLVHLSANAKVEVV